MTADMREAGRRRAGSTVGTLAFILFGPIVWAAHLMAVYASQAALCARGMAGTVPATVGVATAIGLVALLAVLVAPHRVAAGFGAGNWSEQPGRFAVRVAVLLAALSLFAIAAEGITVMAVSSCVQAR